MSKNLYMEKIGKNAKAAYNNLSNLNIKRRNAVLKQFSIYLKIYSKLILKANKKDLLKAKKNKSSIIDRLRLNDEKINQIRKSIKEIIKFKDPLGKFYLHGKGPMV